MSVGIRMGDTSSRETRTRTSSELPILCRYHQMVILPNQTKETGKGYTGSKVSHVRQSSFVNVFLTFLKLDV